MVAKQPTQEQIKEFWEWCGWVRTPHGWSEPHSAFIWESLPTLDLNNLFKYAVLIVIPKLETRFTEAINKARALEIISWKWAEKIAEGYSIEDALFWVLREVIPWIRLLRS